MIGKPAKQISSRKPCRFCFAWRSQFMISNPTNAKMRYCISANSENKSRTILPTIQGKPPKFVATKLIQPNPNQMKQTMHEKPIQKASFRDRASNNASRNGTMPINARPHAKYGGKLKTSKAALRAPAPMKRHCGF